MSPRWISWALAGLLLGTALRHPTALCQETLVTNEDICNMAQKKVPEALILRLIESAACAFELDAKNLIALTEAGVSEQVQTAMWDRMRVTDDEIKRRIQMLIQTLRTAKQQEYRRAVRELTRIGARAVPELVKSLANPDELVRAGVAEVLGEIRDPRSMQPLFDLFDDEHPGVRAKGGQAIAKMAGKETVGRLLRILDAGGPRRDGPALCLGYLKEKKAIKPLVALMQDPLATTEDRAAAAFALGWVADVSALEMLIVEVTTSRVPRLRESAAKAVARIGPYYGVAEKVTSAKALVKSYERFPHSRPVVAEAMGEFALAPVIEVLIEGLNDPNPEVVDACYESLKHATGEVFDRDFEQWSSWFQLARPRFVITEEPAEETVPEEMEEPAAGTGGGEPEVIPLEKVGE